MINNKKQYTLIHRWVVKIDFKMVHNENDTFIQIELNDVHYYIRWKF